jgi:sugar-specific transcriptional regulator TrmB
MSRTITLHDLKQTELVDANFFKQEVKKYEELCMQLANELKQTKIKSFSNDHYIKELEDNYKEAMLKLKELNLNNQQTINVTKPSGSEFIKNMKDYLTKDLGLSDQDIKKIQEENLKRLRNLTA